MTLRPSHPPGPTTGGLTASSGVSPARISATPASGLGSTVSAPACGPNTRGSLAFYDPDSSSWRTWQRCLIEGLTEFSGTWPRAGMTRNGIVYRRASLVPATFGIESFWLPTPQARDGQSWYVVGDKTRASSGWARMRDGRQLHLVHAMQLLLGHEDKAWMNPRFTELVMGFPLGWTDLEDSETPSSRK
jgi:hypothetical protein